MKKVPSFSKAILMLPLAIALLLLSHVQNINAQVGIMGPALLQANSPNDLWDIHLYGCNVGDQIEVGMVLESEGAVILTGQTRKFKASASQVDISSIASQVFPVEYNGAGLPLIDIFSVSGWKIAPGQYRVKYNLLLWNSSGETSSLEGLHEASLLILPDAPLMGLSPQGSYGFESNNTLFSWVPSVAGGERYRLDVFSTGEGGQHQGLGTLIHSQVVDGSSVLVNNTMFENRKVDAQYAWTVTKLEANGKVQASEPVYFGKEKTKSKKKKSEIIAPIYELKQNKISHAVDAVNGNLEVFFEKLDLPQDAMASIEVRGANGKVMLTEKDFKLPKLISGRNYFSFEFAKKAKLDKGSYELLFKLPNNDVRGISFKVN